MVLTASHLHKQFTDRPILADESFTIEEGDKIALIGVNGTGKSTLLHILDGSEDFDGTIMKSGGLKIRLLPQIPVFTEKTIWQEMKKLNSSLKEPREEFELRSILTRLSLNDENAEIETLSGGQKRRLSLALCLADKADLLLLDEPTNHLDNDMTEWLENWLIKSKAAVFMVTHDRYFLERVCTRILELDHGQLYEHEGNYETYLQNRQERIELEQSRQQKLNNLYRKELSWVRAGVQARSTKSRSRLQRFEELRQARQQNIEASFELAMPSIRLGRKTLEWKDLGFAYPDGETLFDGFSYLCKRSDRIGIVGPNGCGKSTFLKLLDGELKPTEGTIEQGSTVRIGFFRQDYTFTDQSVRVRDFIEETAREVRTEDGLVSASAMLERFLFDSQMQHLPIEWLSGGEQRRLYLLKVLMEAPNVLLLDEPTNDLDLVTLEVLEDYLDEFPGIVITVSHDRYFLDRICTDLFVHTGNASWRRFTGGYTDFLAVQQEEKAQERQEKSPTKTAGQTGSSRRRPSLTSKQKRELEELPQQMESVQAQIEALNEAMGTESDFVRIAQISDERDALEADLESMEERWLELEELKEQYAL